MPATLKESMAIAANSEIKKEIKKAENAYKF